ncbi:riboflavin synthase subunit alpha [Sodalis-like endosymbiont of Proechinophthirus fluctus]|uniref:riboflavin synthase n=1 Tax=Sodalis-like endosymbiont of Proechinophthirus fluctus TaxID=1462730 RepID=UPI0007A82E8E|nr:riboflavin synthase [Sodalis-like endosymbiont of Proechinophthirus fluctus]KYP97485.1 riboflavin synthase subunit alpha [Sodalis-like endosymbiont of Proechinophthirus fluctus]
MFTGIVQATAPITAIEEKNHFRIHYVRLPAALLLNLTIGASVTHNGCCLTVTGISGDVVSFDLMKETLRLTNLGELTVGDEVNLERAASLHAEIGGHLMSGHIICTAELTKIITSENNRQMWFSLPNSALMKYILHKGHIGVDGISLTVGEVAGNRFCVHLIPETLLRTTLGKKRLSDSANIEIDPQTQAIVDTVERTLATRERS